MLDPTMAYSCAYWERPDMTLEEAQVAKFRAVCEKLHLGSDDHLLEIGCGWGGLAIHAAREYGCRVTGVTSRVRNTARRRARRERRAGGPRRDPRAGLPGRRGSFSRVASIEMFEAIGLAEHENYFATIDRLLAPGGLALIQTIAIPDDRFERYRRSPDWIQQYIFPGSLIPSLEAITRAVARDAG